MKKASVLFVFMLALTIISGCGKISVDLGTGQDSVSENETVVSGDINEAHAEPATSNKSSDLIPDGVLISTGNETSLTYLDVNGQAVLEIETPGIITIYSEDAAIAGAVPLDGNFPPVIYHSWLPEQALMVNTNGQVETLRISNSFLALIGAPGQPAVAFSEVLLNEENNPHSFIFAGNRENLGSIPAFYDLVDEPYYWALKPVGIKTIAGEVQGVWYVKTAWGIGGADLIFPINRGLYFFDLTNGDNIQYLDDERSLQGVSPDLAYAASVETDMSGDRSMTAIKLITNEQVNFALDPSSDRGAGFAVFSPDNRYTAWLEAAGSMISDPYDFHPSVRIGDIKTGGVVQTVDDVSAAQIINSNSVTMMRPVGWLDNEAVIIEIRGENWNDVSLLRFYVPTGELTVFASGSFIVFGYH